MAVSFPFKMELAVDANIPGYVARNSIITFYDPANLSTPLILKDGIGLPMNNPVTTTPEGYVPAFQAPLEIVLWSDGAGHSGYYSSPAGMSSAAEASRVAAESAAAAAAQTVAASAAASSAAQAAAASAANASGGAALSPDPNNPGLWFFTPGGQISPDPNAEGIYIVGASA